MAALVISQHTIMSAAMLNAKRARMKVEADRQLLANRIARLQAEEMKSVKRIEETHRRTQEILLLKTRQQQGELEKEAVKHEEEARLTAHREHLVKQKEERKYAVLAARQAAARTAVRCVGFCATRRSRVWQPSTPSLSQASA